MFSNFNNIDTTYQPNPFQPKYPTNCCTNNAVPASPNKPYEILSADKSKVLGYFWYYGNSVDLIFDFSDSVYGYTSENISSYENKPIAILVEELLPQLKLEATIYNFRYEPILKFSNDFIISNNEIKIDKDKVIISITSELSSKLVKGVYSLDLIATHNDGYHETLFSSQQNELKFEVR